MGLGGGSASERNLCNPDSIDKPPSLYGKHKKQLSKGRGVATCEANCNPMKCPGTDSSFVLLEEGVVGAC